MRKRIYPITLGLLLPFLAISQWSTNPAVNNAINTTAGEQAIPKVATCPNGDTYIGFFSNESGNYNVRLQRLDAQGNEMWATGGILVSDNPQMTWLTDWDMTADNANHAIIAFQDIRNGGNNNVVAYRIAPDGTFVWGADGIALSNSTAFDAAPKVCATAAGNAVFAWSSDDVTIIQKVSPTGTLMWGTSGITLSGGTARITWPQLLPVGTDEVILKYFSDTGPVNAPTRHVYAQRYDANGTGVWASPVVVSNAGGISAWTQIFPFINDGSDGFYIAWHDDRDNNQRSSTFVQHISSAGTALFTANGVEASTDGSMNHFYPQLALPPGSADIYVFWNEMNGLQSQWGLYGQKLGSTGTRLWANTGQVFVALSTTDVYPIAARNSPTDVVLFYEEYVDAINGYLKAMRIDASGNFVWSPSIKTICSVNSEKVHVDVNDYADNQWILSWEDTRNSGRDIYAQNIQLDGSLGPYVPQDGTIEGTVTLVGGAGNVSSVSVTAGDVTVNPDGTGFYTLVVPAGTYEVTASLIGYASDTVQGVVVVVSQTTSGVDLTLNALPTGFITGNVVLNGGTGNVTNVQVTAGYHTVYPDANGDYTMEIEVGTYDVHAGLAGYVPQTNPGIVVLEGMTTVNVDFELNPVPTTGFIEGTVELENGAGDVTQVDVTAGTVTVHPDVSGYYLLEITAGTWDVSASLDGFYTQVVSNVTVVVEQTTSNIDFLLLQLPDGGFVEGYVTLVNGIRDVTDATVSAGGQITHPSASGHYFLTLPEGTYTVYASHPYTLTDSITDITVVAGETVSDVDFELEIVRGDLVCIAMDTYNTLLNGIDVELVGPDSTLTGTITSDSIVFMNVSYGEYNGTAWMPEEDPVTADTLFDQDNNHIVFVFDLTGIKANDPVTTDFKVYPNPFTDNCTVTFDNKTNESPEISIYSVSGKRVRVIRGSVLQGIQSMTWNGTDDAGRQLAPGTYFIVLRTKSGQQGAIVIRK